MNQRRKYTFVTNAVGAKVGNSWEYSNEHWSRLVFSDFLPIIYPTRVFRFLQRNDSRSTQDKIWVCMNGSTFSPAAHAMLQIHGTGFRSYSLFLFSVRNAHVHVSRKKGSCCTGMDAPPAMTLILPRAASTRLFNTDTPCAAVVCCPDVSTRGISSSIKVCDGQEKVEIEAL